MAFTCPVETCSTTFVQKCHLLRNLRNSHGNLWSCGECRQQFNRYINYELHKNVCIFKTTGKRKASDDDRPSKRPKESGKYLGGSLNGTLAEYRLNLKNENQEDILKTLNQSVLNMKGSINDELHEKNAIKYYLSSHVNFHLSMDESFTTNPPVVLSTTPIEVFKFNNIEKSLADTYDNLISKIGEFQSRGSGWVLDELVMLDLHILEYKPLRASSYIPLPEKLASRKAVINIKNKDQKCFLWSVIAGTFLKDSKLINADRLSHYKNMKTSSILKVYLFLCHWLISPNLKLETISPYLCMDMIMLFTR